MPYRVLFPFVGDSIGGSHLSALELIHALDGTDYEAIVGIHSSGPLAAEIERRSLSWIPLPQIPLAHSLARNPMRAARMVAAIGPLGRQLALHGIDIVHTNDSRMHHTWLLPAKAAGVRHIWHQRTPFFKPSRGRFAKFADRVVAVSPYCLDSFPRSLREQSTTIWNPITACSTELETEIARRYMASQFSEDVSTILGSVANWIPRKRPQLLVDIAARVVNQDPSYGFVMIGSHPNEMQRRLSKLIDERRLHSNFLILPHRSPIAPWIQSFDLLLAPAVGEAFGRTLAEAMLLCVPVVAADDGGHRDIVGDRETGMLAKPDDYEDFARVVMEVCQTTELRDSIVGNAYIMASQRFAPDAHIARIVDLYHSALNG